MNIATEFPNYVTRTNLSLCRESVTKYTGTLSPTVLECVTVLSDGTNLLSIYRTQFYFWCLLRNVLE